MPASSCSDFTHRLRADRALVGVGVFEAAVDGGEDDAEVEEGGPVIEVVEVVLEAFFEGGSAAEAVDLGPASEAGADFEAEGEAGDFLLDFFEHFGAFGTWADEGHVAF